ncbi:polyphosphate kinase 1 [Adhaeribacter rhizoryzae]|uniref:Polyphosphate kinase n=1 Tax=Adhaeribacter rhizoryzae TaxID=2607907 RepID=A0A5M6DSH2_9BACT|nr:polyphosphate kinase 1 [Adhaeribacter rhizoryzae]KAA5549182.1 polyphosphate kinase 1 [Adhaeribacter rhizoryzae]
MEKDKKIFNRELSWLAFNHRVLQEAKDPTVPLLERIKFMAIFSSNLDEYFKVRVATLKKLIKLKKKTLQKLKDDPSQELDNIIEEVTRQQHELGDIFRNQILPDLRSEHINLLTEKELSPEQETFVRQYFAKNLQNFLTPVMLTDGVPHVFLKDQVVYLAIRLFQPKRPQLHPEAFALMEVPVKKHGGRFVKLPEQDGNHYVLFLEDVIRLCLPQLFPDYNQAEAYAIKISRDAELDIEEEVSGNLMAKIQRSLKKRETGYPARLLYDPATPAALLDIIQIKTGITDDELISGSKYHNFREFFSFPDFDLPRLKYEPQPTLPHPQLRFHKSMLEAIYHQDFLLHYPYQSFEYVIRFFEEAAADPAVKAISATLYRVADKSKVAKALVKAAENGKLVTVVVELKARFDEESNIYWAQKLEKAGATVIYGVEGYKVHTKLGLVTRQEGRKMVNYAYLSTGNFNEVTSYIYADHAIFTRDVRLTKDVEKVFQFFFDRLPNKRFKHLLVAPFNMRDRFNDLINEEIRNAKKGLPAYLILKMNALQDERMILRLYEASKAGVKVELIVRGICSLIPGIPGLSDNITVRSIIDRYLEHARVYIFCNNNQEKLYIASADWMTRNLNRRIEVGFPIYNETLRQEIRHIVELQRIDNVKARNTRNVYLRRSTEPETRSQYATYHFLKELNPAYEKTLVPET